MKGDKKIIAILNEVLKNELTAINQYFLHSRMLKDWGLARLADKEYEESIDEMKHADQVMERILFLEGLPNLQALHHLRIGENISEVLEGDLALEADACKTLKKGIPLAEELEDYVSRDLMTSILESEEGHIDWLETQLALIKRIGVENYQQSQIGE